MGMKTALITGITGQDGSYLAELLLSKGYRVFGLMRRSSNFSTARIDHLLQDKHTDPPLRLIHGDLTDGACLTNVLNEVQPDEVYNLAGQSHVRVSFDQPVYTHDANALGTLRLLEAIRAMKGKRPRFYQASSSEMFGNSPAPQDENTPFRPCSPYGVAKLAAHWHTVNYREAYGLFACSGILFNHESPRRGETFVTRKITRAVTRIKCGLQDKLYLGNLNAKRDWGFAGDYVKAMWLMLQQDEPDDFVAVACVAAGIDEDKYEDCVECDSRYLRPNELHHLRGNPAKAERKLGWATKRGVPALAVMMVESDMRLAENEAMIRKNRSGAGANETHGKENTSFVSPRRFQPA
jgi:GDPmannose 4,6-dehydratase